MPYSHILKKSPGMNLQFAPGTMPSDSPRPTALYAESAAAASGQETRVWDHVYSKMK